MLWREVLFTVTLKKAGGGTGGDSGTFWLLYFILASLSAPDWREEAQTSSCLIGYLIAVIIPVFIRLCVLSPKAVRGRAGLSAAVPELLNVY